MHTSASAHDPQSRQQRHATIVRLVGSRSVRSQAELAELLAGEGFTANQATLSRDLRELGVLKGGDGYALPAPELLDDLTRACREWLRTAEAIAHQIVLRTPAGGAQPLAVALDRTASDREESSSRRAFARDVAGTIAGDDTILVICRSPAAATRVARGLLARLPR